MFEREATAEFLRRQEKTMHAEVAAHRNELAKIWSLELHHRVTEGHSLGPLKVESLQGQELTLSHVENTSRQSFSRIQEGNLLKLSRNKPTEPGARVTFVSDDGEIIRVLLWGALPDSLSSGHGLTLDPEFFDPTERFLAVLEALAKTSHGVENVLPLLMGEGESDDMDGGLYSDEIIRLEQEEQALHEAQQEAMAQCLAASRYHLVQGPPGTGKTHLLARLAHDLLERDHRLLVVAPTHRAIHNALSAIRGQAPARFPVVKIGGLDFSKGEIPCFENLAEAKLPEDLPHVIGCTPYALWSSRSGLSAYRADAVLVDEASQLTLLLAAMAMLRAEKFFFFGDDCQLPPVRLTNQPKDEQELSIFSRLKSHNASTLLTESWRLNPGLAEWPSATFYHNELTAKFDRRLHLGPPSNHPALQDEPSFLAISHDNSDCSTFSSDEAESALELILEALQGGVAAHEIALLTPFRAQAAFVRGTLRRRTEFSNYPVEEIVCDTVERLQGQERDLVIISYVASRDQFILRLADFLFQSQRLNVAITRARRKSVFLHSQRLLEIAQSLADHHLGARHFCSLLETSLTIPSSPKET